MDMQPRALRAVPTMETQPREQRRATLNASLE